MTSSRCLIKYCREDMRHKVWMLVLSVLGNVLAMPVAYLLYLGQRGYGVENAHVIANYANRVSEFIRIGFLACAGVVAGAGVLIVAIGGFHYVFHKNMVDTYESLPIRKRDRFLVSWLNGFLIWLVPFVLSWLAMVVLGCAKYASLKKEYLHLIVGKKVTDTVIWLTPSEMFLKSLQSAAVLLVCFLVLYHLLILAISLAGNVLNAIVVCGVIGAGAVAVYGLGMLFCSMYFLTWINTVADQLKMVCYASPLASVFQLVYQYSKYLDNAMSGSYPGVLIGNLILAVVLFAAAVVAFLKRPSELAGQGIRNRAVCFVTQTVVTVCTVFAGWALLYVVCLEMSNTGRNVAVIWAVFGGVLGGVFLFGVMDILFRMDFKSFFLHKKRMAATVLLSLLGCLCFAFDFFGYDSYIPKENRVAEIAIITSDHTNYSYISDSVTSENHPLQKMHITDVQKASAFLKKAVESTDLSRADRIGETVYAKIVLTNGRTYYRRYWMPETEELLALTSLPEYIEAAYMFGDETGYYSRVEFERLHYSETTTDANRIRILCEAYNEDVRQTGIERMQTGRVWCRVNLNDYQKWESSRVIYVTENMPRTVRALQEIGYASAVETIAPQSVAKIELSLDDWVEFQYGDANENGVLYEAAEYAYKTDATYPDMAYPISAMFRFDVEGSDFLRNYSAEQMLADYLAGKMPYRIVMSTQEDSVEALYGITLEVTDSAAVSELLNVISYANDWRNTSDTRYLRITEINGETYTAYIEADQLPEIYLTGFMIAVQESNMLK